MIPTYYSPIIILTLKGDNNNTFYKAFSPSEYLAPDDDSGDRDIMFEQFENKVYEHIQYNINGLDNTTNIGTLLEVHSRFNSYPVDQRGEYVWFSTYQNTFTSYMCIHRESPIHFCQEDAIKYLNMQPELGHTSCEHIVL